MPWEIAKQKTNAPTRKLVVAAVVGPIVSGAWSNILPVLVSNNPGNYALLFLDTFGMAFFMGLLASIIIGWFVPDAPNEKVD